VKEYPVLLHSARRPSRYGLPWFPVQCASRALSHLAW